MGLRLDVLLPACAADGMNSFLLVLLFFRHLYHTACCRCQVCTDRSPWFVWDHYHSIELVHRDLSIGLAGFFSSDASLPGFDLTRD